MLACLRDTDSRGAMECEPRVEKLQFSGRPISFDKHRLMEKELFSLIRKVLEGKARLSIK